MRCVCFPRHHASDVVWHDSASPLGGLGAFGLARPPCTVHRARRAVRAGRTEASGTMGSTRALQTTLDVTPWRSAVLVEARAAHATVRPVSGSVTVEARVDGPNG